MGELRRQNRRLHGIEPLIPPISTQRVFRPPVVGEATDFSAIPGSDVITARVSRRPQVLGG
jgi:hypothetical protein